MPLISIAGISTVVRNTSPATILMSWSQSARAAPSRPVAFRCPGPQSHEREGVREQKQSPGSEREGQRAVEAFGHLTVEDRAAAPTARRARRQRRLALKQIAIVASDKRRGRHRSNSKRIKPSIVEGPQVYVGVKSPVLGM